MIVKFEADKIDDIAVAQICAWKEAFKGILSSELLASLKVESFASNWERILAQPTRKNYIWLDENDKGVGFISFGTPKEKNEIAQYEIYGLYVHPKYWGQGIGFRLMTFAFDELNTINPYAKIVLWTMRKNQISRTFYTRFGFIENGKHRLATRNGESFEEIQFEYASKQEI